MKNPGMATNMFETLQWFVFLLASAVALPIVIGSLYQLDAAEMSGLMQRTFFTVGIASLLQALFGHRLPIMEIPAGIWVSIFAVMAVTGIQMGETYMGILQTMEATMLTAGFFLFLLGAFKISQKMLPIFTPLVMGTFFLLLTVQLSETLLKGMLGLNEDTHAIQGKEAMIAMLTFMIVLGLSTFAKGWLSSYAMFIGILLGWGLFVAVIGTAPQETAASWFALPEMFAFGPPAFDFSILPTAFIIAIISISNIVASIEAGRKILEERQSKRMVQVNRGTMFSGINHMIAGGFSSVANVPSATSAGFIALTGQKRKLPFVCATILLMLFAFFPPVTSMIAGIPAPVANAALMASFVQLVGIGINNFTLEPLDSRKLTIVGVAYLFGMGGMFLPSEVFADMPMIVQNLLSNGLLVGTGLVILLEQLWKTKKA